MRGSSRKDSTSADAAQPAVRIRRGKKLIKPDEDAPRRLSHSRTNESRRPVQAFRDSKVSSSRSYDKGRPAYTRNRDSDSSRLHPSDPQRNSFGYKSQSTQPSSNFKSRVLDSHDVSSPPTNRSNEAATVFQRSSTYADKRIPLSIPYTTPASEFLYGTSVVEAALNSQREPRRKLYKLYIYTGENREKVDAAGLERLARRKGIEVARVGVDWIRVLDKMSGGRPHNGYILEASPLPRPPVAHLGELDERDGEPGFKVELEHQSREDAAINGTSDFIKLPRKLGRSPFVLFLDSIEDPGNLGGIIRTASFLGVTAVAYSVRNSASFTPIVLKASAGASENVTLFAVNKPAGFIANSKLAGWKIYAAVAPAKSMARYGPQALCADELQNPLSQDPCILMLGGEGEGLRTNLRSKADFDVSIRGRGQSHNIDSLNVSVAAGILCDAFLRRNRVRGSSTPPDVEAKPDSITQPTRDLF